jgi:hypothetical protein
MKQSAGYFRKPVEGWHSARYMLIMVVSLAVTVIVVRVYLELAGYPQLGNKTFHFAHALWGGLLQIIAASLMLIYLNEWVFSLSAALAGIGLGLFIDEIGKFITQTNDYFFPLAAPIIYVAMIFGVLVYLFVRRNEACDARGEMYIALEELKSLADKNMDALRHARLVNRLGQLAAQSERPDLAAVARALLQALPAETTPATTAEPHGINGVIEWAKRLEARRLTRVVARRLLILFFLVFGAFAIVEIAILLAIVLDRGNLEAPLIALLVKTNSLISSPYSLNWYFALMTIESIVGLFYLVTLAAFLSKRDLIAAQSGSIGLILSLTVGNTLAFYFDQFSVAANSLALLIGLVLVFRYRDRFLRQSSTTQEAHSG